MLQNNWVGGTGFMAFALIMLMSLCSMGTIQQSNVIILIFVLFIEQDLHVWIINYPLISVSRTSISPAKNLLIITGS